MGVNRPLRIGITCYPTSGGSGIVATELGKALADRGHQVHFISYAVPYRLRHFAENVYFHQVDSPSYPIFNHSPYSLSLAVKMREVAENHALDLLHVHYAVPHATSAYLAREMFAPRRLATVTTLHGTDITLVGNHPSYQAVTRFSIEHSDGVTAVSESLRRDTQSFFGTDKEIRVIPNFVCQDQFRPREVPEVRRRFAPGDERILMHASNFREVKNLDGILEIFRRVQSEVAAVLMLVGDGPQHDRISRICSGPEFAGKVFLLGDVEFIEELLPVGDIFLLPSRQESFGLAALEAMSCGVPVIASNAGGLPEVIRDGEGGFLFAPDDLGGMARCALELLRDEPRRREVAHRGRERAVARFSLDDAVGRYEGFYREVLEEVGGDAEHPLGMTAGDPGAGA
jgi:N-acetyl-alpha-D-glucosaminyl L-malate synthase BshA